MLPFTTQQFVAVFVAYNEAIWPVQLAAYVLGCGAVVLLFWKTANADRAIAGILGLMWVWTGILYHGLFFASINKAAFLFAAMFTIQGSYLVYSGVIHHRIQFGFRSNPAGWLGAGFVSYAMILYPSVGILTGHAYPEMPAFGVTPCPVTIFTFGMLLLTTGLTQLRLFVIPLLWSLIGGSAAILLNVPQDWLLLASGTITIPVIIAQTRATAAMM